MDMNVGMNVRGSFQLGVLASWIGELVITLNISIDP